MSAATLPDDLVGDEKILSITDEDATFAVRRPVPRRGDTTLAPAARSLWCKLAGIYDRTGRRDDARHALHQAVALADPSDTPVLAGLHTWLAGLKTQDRRFEDPLHDFEQAKKYCPTLVAPTRRRSGSGLG